jgi:CBS domain-containing protein
MNITNSNNSSPSAIDSAKEKDLHKCSQNKKIKDIMSTEIMTITPEKSMGEALTLMIEKNIGSLIVISYATPVGMITERDLLSKVLALGKDLREVKVEAVMSYPLITIAPSAEIKESAKMMIQQNVRRLAVFDVGKLVGIVTALDVIRSLHDSHEVEGIVDDLMTKRLQHADEKTPISRIIEIMVQKHVGSIIVTRKGEPIGIFTERDLLSTFLVKGRHGGVFTEEDMLSTSFVKGKPLFAEVGKEASLNLITAPIGTSLKEAAALMAKKHIRRLPIEKDGKLVGIITAHDLIEEYAK